MKQKPKSLMIQGTGSGVGKSIIVAGLCRKLRKDGYRVAPFKSQNMALNSFVTLEGKEMGRAQVMQAEASGVEPMVEMNPILLKPVGDKGSQVIIMGEPYKNMRPEEYYDFVPQAEEIIRKSYDTLSEKFEAIVIEGAGSPAEINLFDRDIVNMKTAELTDSPVILVGDIDKGGVFASIVGTIEMLSERYRSRIKGILINKFRGEKRLLKSGIDYIERRLGIPVLGVIPYFRTSIDEEDSLGLNDKLSGMDEALDIVVVKLPRISNFTDFDPFRRYGMINLRFVCENDKLGRPDLIILPGTKNTIEDIRILYESGLAEQIKLRVNSGAMLAGICGGFQMMGKKVSDPEGVESGRTETEGFCFFATETVIEKKKTTHQVEGIALKGKLPFLKSDSEISGYEIHAGITSGPLNSPFRIKRKNDGDGALEDGDASLDGKIWGSYVHGIFDSDAFREQLLDYLLMNKFRKPLQQKVEYSKMREESYDSLMANICDNIDFEKIKAVMGL